MPGSIRAAGIAAGAENRPSRIPAGARASGASGATETPVASNQPEATPTAPGTSSTPEQQAPVRAADAAVHAGARTEEATTGQPGQSAEAHTQPAAVSVAHAAAATPIAIEPPLATVISPSHEPLQPAASRREIRDEFAAPAMPVDSTPSSLPPQTRNRAPLWAFLWLASVAAAAVGGWLAKPTPRPKPVNCDCTSKVESAVRDAMQQRQRAADAPAAAPAPSPTPTASPSEGTGGADSQSATTIASATSPSSTVPVVVETKSNDRIDVLVKSRPSNVKVWRLGRAIGRTPLVIQIGRGEHRIFEVGGPAVGVRRLSLNGEKTEVTVDLIPPGKPAK